MNKFERDFPLDKLNPMLFLFQCKKVMFYFFFLKAKRRNMKAKKHMAFGDI